MDAVIELEIPACPEYSSSHFIMSYVKCYHDTSCVYELDNAGEICDAREWALHVKWNKAECDEAGGGYRAFSCTAEGSGNRPWTDASCRFSDDSNWLIQCIRQR